MMNYAFLNYCNTVICSKIITPLINFILRILRIKVTSYTGILRALPVDTGRKLNVHKTFRRRLGRLLNVLCTFNLRPVSTR